MFSIFQKKSKVTGPGWGLSTDIHSHLLPGIDDGVKSIEESIDLILKFKEAGIKKLITTPHVMPEFYPNTPDIIGKKHLEVLDEIKKREIDIEFKASAEYFLDDTLVQKLENDEKLLTFGDHYLLFELSFLNEPFYLREAIFQMQSKGYRPVLAHPERYVFLQQNWNLVEEIRDRGVLFQMNLLSLAGYYGKPISDFAKKLIKHKMIDLAGSDCHNSEQFEALNKIKKQKALKDLLSLDLLNDQI